MERPILKELDKEEKITPNHKYEQTLTYSRHFQSVLFPIHSFWPEYSHEEYTKDLKSVVWATPKQIESLTKNVNSKINKGAKVIEVEKLYESVKEGIDKYSKEKTFDLKKHKSFKKGKYKPTCMKRKGTNVSKIYKKFEGDSLGTQALRRVLAVKYGLDENTAKSWLFEFVKFITIKMIETDDDIQTNSFPCSIVECTWQTFYELGHYYRETCKFLFPDEIPPFPEAVVSSFQNYEECAKRYGQTLEMYNDLFQEEPNPEIWETVEQRFPQQNDDGKEADIDDPNKRVAFNAYRIGAYVSAKIVSSTGGPKPAEGIVYNEVHEKEYFKPINSDNNTKRNQNKNNNKLYRWRINYPHCSNVYVKHQREDADQAFIYNPNSKHFKSALAFENGGFLFFSNPFNPSTLKLVSAPKQPLVRSVDLDNLADRATLMVEYKYDSAPSNPASGLL